jgi:hypothetical protein
MPSTIIYQNDVWYVLNEGPHAYYCTRRGEYRWIHKEDAR